MTKTIKHNEIATSLQELSERTRGIMELQDKLEAQLQAMFHHAVPVPVRARVQDTAATELYAQITNLLTRQPMTYLQLVEETKADGNKIKTVLVRMQREENGLVNLGNQYKAVWFIPDRELLKRLAKD